MTAPAPQATNRDFAVLVIEECGRPYYIATDPPQPPAPEIAKRESLRRV